MLDRDFGLAFIKFSSYAPFNVRVWVNGHEWAKRQLDRKGIKYQSLDNGFLSCDDPAALQKVCDSLSADHIDAFFRRWLKREREDYLQRHGHQVGQASGTLGKPPPGLVETLLSWSSSS